MNEFASRRPGFQRPNSDVDFDKTLVRVILQILNPEVGHGFFRKLMRNYAPDVQVKLFEFVHAIICCWAGRDDLSHEDASVIEDCRKVCDFMGWMPEKL